MGEKIILSREVQTRRILDMLSRIKHEIAFLIAFIEDLRLSLNDLEKEYTKGVKQ